MSEQAIDQRSLTYQPPWARPVASDRCAQVIATARMLFPDWPRLLPDFGEGLLALLGVKPAGLLMDWPWHDAPRLRALVQAAPGAALLWPPGRDPLVYRPEVLLAAVKRIPALTRRLGLRHAPAARIAEAAAGWLDEELLGVALGYWPPDAARWARLHRPDLPWEAWVPASGGRPAHLLSQFGRRAWVDWTTWHPRGAAPLVAFYDCWQERVERLLLEPVGAHYSAGGR